ATTSRSWRSAPSARPRAGTRRGTCWCWPSPLASSWVSPSGPTCATKGGPTGEPSSREVRTLPVMRAHPTSPWRRFAVPRSAALWLIYLVMLVFQPAFDTGRNAADWLAVVAMVVVFVPLYGWTTRHADPRPYFWRRGPGALVGIVGMALMGLVLSAVNSGAAVFFVYAAATAGRIRPRRRALQLIAGIMVVTLVAVLISPIETPYRWF